MSGCPTRSPHCGGSPRTSPLSAAIPTATAALDRTRALARHLGHGDDIEALRQEPWERLILGTTAVIGEYRGFGDWALAFTPVLDPETLPRNPAAALADADIDILMGWTRDEASFSFGMDPSYRDASREQVTAWAARYGEHATAIAEQLPPAEAVIRIVGDAWFRGPGLHLARERSAARPAHVYQFDVNFPVGAPIGATHCLEIPFVFGNLPRWSAAPFVRDFDPARAERVTDLLHRSWIAFIRDGDPTHPGLPSWSRYDSETPAILVIGDDDAKPSPTLNPSVITG
ncbi:carboxylesterase family protein [Nocardia crassostreae]|uniref:carboxylesterase family protein n=1 Tax=Nocardia crassostreae TaxID=53428 RepID=UPI000832FEBC|nr:carboxylesterase family protein [Nocardia crassostreae]